MNNIKILFLSLFFISLIWDVVYPNNILVISLLLLNILFILDKKIVVKTKNINIYFFIFLILFLLINIIQYSTFNELLYISYSQFSSLNFSLFLSLFCFMFLPFIFQRDVNTFLKAIDLSILIIVSIFYLQIIIYYTTGNYLEILQFFRGTQSKYMAYDSMITAFGSNLIRPTSIFNEPGTYVCYTFVLFIISYINHKRITKLHALFLVSSFLSLSAFGILLSFLFIIFHITRNLKIQKIFTLKSFIISIPLLFLIFYFIKFYYEIRFLSDLTQNQGGLGIRYNVFDVFFSGRNNIFIGASLGYSGSELRYIQDTGLLNSIFIFFGIFGTLIIYFMLKFLRFKIILIILLAIILSSKITIESYAFWFFLVSLRLVYFNLYESKKA